MAQAHDPGNAPQHSHAPQPSPAAQHNHGHGDSHGHGSAGLAHQEILDLDAEVAAPQLAALISRVADLVTTAVRHLVDVGAGTGTGTFALLRHFPEATATALDTSGEMLDHLAKYATRHGLADRIHPLRADLDDGWPHTEPADLIWASSSMHHMAHPGRVLRDIHTALRPGGVFVMLEMEHLPRFLPHDLGPDFGTPGLEARLHAVSEQARDEHLPHMGADWPTLLTSAGFTIHESGTLDVALPAPLPAPALRYARATLERFSAGMADRLSPQDRTALHHLLTAEGRTSLEQRPDLTITSTRNLWICTAAAPH